MTQRNFMNERYTDETRTGKSRKSAASAKPKAQRAATVRDPAPKSKKQKKAEARERERAAAQKTSALQSRFEETPGYKKLRRIWWVMLVGAIVCTALSFVLQNNESLKQFSIFVMVAAYALIIIAFYIDLGKIRKERKIYNAALLNNKSKEARKEQKRLKEEMRAQEREAAEKYEAAKAEADEKDARRRQRFMGLFSRGKGEKEENADEADKAEKATS